MEEKNFKIKVDNAFEKIFGSDGVMANLVDEETSSEEQKKRNRKKMQEATESVKETFEEVSSPTNDINKKMKPATNRYSMTCNPYDDELFPGYEYLRLTEIIEKPKKIVPNDRESTKKWLSRDVEDLDSFEEPDPDYELIEKLPSTKKFKNAKMRIYLEDGEQIFDVHFETDVCTYDVMTALKSNENLDLALNTIKNLDDPFDTNEYYFKFTENRIFAVDSNEDEVAVLEPGQNFWTPIVANKDEEETQEWNEYVVFEYDPIEAYATFMAADSEYDCYQSMLERVVSTEFMSSKKKVKEYEKIQEETYGSLRPKSVRFELKDAPKHFRNVTAEYDPIKSMEDAGPKSCRLRFESDKSYFELLKSVKDEQSLLNWTFLQYGYCLDYDEENDDEVVFKKNEFVRGTYDEEEGRLVRWRLRPKQDDWDAVEEDNDDDEEGEEDDDEEEEEKEVIVIED